MNNEKRSIEQIGRLAMRLQLVCTDNNFKGADLHRWGPGTREIYSVHWDFNGNCIGSV